MHVDIDMDGIVPMRPESLAHSAMIINYCNNSMKVRANANQTLFV